MEKLNIRKMVRHKYYAKPQKINNMHFDSKKEAKYYGQLNMLQKCGEILFFLRQVPFHLPGNIIYRVDFMEFHKDGSVHFVDVKGYITQMAKNKIKQVEALYPINIEIK